MPILPGGFSPRRAVQQVGSFINPTGGVADYNIFGNYSYRGGARSPASGATFGSGPVTRTGLASGGQEFTPPNLTMMTMDPSALTDDGQVQGQSTDPYARYGGVDNYNALISGIDAQRDAIVDAGRRAMGGYVGQYGMDTQAFGNQIEDTQNSLNKSRSNISLNRMRSVQDLVSNIRQGLQGAGTRLANMNALDSSARDAFARAYANYGNSQRQNIYNQEALANQDINEKQNILARQRDQGLANLSLTRQRYADETGADVAAKLRQLDLEAQGQGITGRIAIDELKQQVVNDGISRLAELDNAIRQRVSAYQALTAQQAEARAQDLDRMGAAANPYAFEAAPATNVIGGGVNPGGVQLPLMFRKPDENDNVA